MKKRSFRYEDGGSVEMEEGSGGYGALPEMEAEKPKTFKEAFAQARAAGEKTFTFNGKKFSTEMAGAPKASTSPISGRPRGESVSAPAPEPQRVEIAGKRYPRDDQSKSVSERLKSARERARTGSGETDTRSVSERLRSSLGFAKGGSVRGGGCERRGKTKGTMR